MMEKTAVSPKVASTIDMSFHNIIANGSRADKSYDAEQDKNMLARARGILEQLGDFNKDMPALEQFPQLASELLSKGRGS